jgi:hypothetical protein
MERKYGAKKRMKHGFAAHPVAVLLTPRKPLPHNTPAANTAAGEIFTTHPNGLTLLT